MLDAHCHLADERIYSRASAVIEDCVAAGVDRFLLGGVSPDEWDRQAELHRQFPARIGMVWGLHPWWVHDQHAAGRKMADFSGALARLREAAPRLSGVGELGLDQIRGPRAESRGLQVEVFRAQLAIARETDSPIVLHVVQAHSEALEILRTEAPRWRGIVHSFAADLATARSYLDLGLLLSISGRVTYPEAKALRQTVRDCPVEALVFETDSPDQPPLGVTANHTPQSLLRVVEEVSILRGLGAEGASELAQKSRERLERIFRWNP
jgi:TatD DNase family protein